MLYHATGVIYGAVTTGLALLLQFKHSFNHEWRNQCDQMAQLFVQFLVIYNNENLPNSIHNLLK